MYQMPESYRAYCTDPAVRTAVDHILDKPDKLGVPSDIEWDELPKFHRAVLSAHQVRCEYANYLIDLWKCIWQPALDNCGFEVTPRTIADTEKWQEWQLDTYNIWKNAWFFRVFDIDDTGSVLSLGTFEEAQPRQMRISLYFWNDRDGVSRLGELNLDNNWDEEEESLANTCRGLARIGDDGAVDLARLCAAAVDALAAVQGRTE